MGSRMVFGTSGVFETSAWAVLRSFGGRGEGNLRAFFFIVFGAFCETAVILFIVNHCDVGPLFFFFERRRWFDFE